MCTFVSKLRNVPGLFVDRALSVMGGSDAVYERVVRMTLRLLPENIRKMDEILEIDLHAYAVEVHGIKGVLNNIGAFALGKQALELEQLSKQGDIGSCRELHPKFKSVLSKFLDDIKPLAGEKDPDERPMSGIGSQMPVLLRLEEAVSFFDSVLALEILLPVEKYTYGKEIDEIITSLRHALEQFNFDRALKLIGLLKGDMLVNE